MPKISPENLLSQLDDLLRTFPKFDAPDLERFAWGGKALAVFNEWDSVRAMMLEKDIDNMNSGSMIHAASGQRKIFTTLHQARHAISLRTSGPLSVSIEHGNVFNYFDEIRKKIELAKTDILFADPYLDADFASKYLPHIKNETNVRLLTNNYVEKLIPAATFYKEQTGISIEIRKYKFHDRYIFIDSSLCFQSGTSFKQGSQNAPTVITQIIDAFDAVNSSYESMWNKAEVVLIK